MKRMAHWFTQHEQGGVEVERAALADYDLSVMKIGNAAYWLVRREGRDVAEGAARAAVDAQRQAEAVARKLSASLG